MGTGSWGSSASPTTAHDGVFVRRSCPRGAESLHKEIVWGTLEPPPGLCVLLQSQGHHAITTVQGTFTEDIPQLYFGCFFMALCRSNGKTRTAGQGFPQMQHGRCWHKFKCWNVFGRHILLKISILNPSVVSAGMWIIDLSAGCPKDQIKTSHPGMVSSEWHPRPWQGGGMRWSLPMDPNHPVILKLVWVWDP